MDIVFPNQESKENDIFFTKSTFSKVNKEMMFPENN